MSNEKNLIVVDETTPNQLTDILQQNNFEDIDTIINNEMESIDSLYSIIRSDLTNNLSELRGDTPSNQQSMRLGSAPRQPQKRVSTVYIAQQVANLNSMKSTKLQMLKEKVRLRESMLDRELKVFLAVNKDKDPDTEKVTEKEVLEYLVKNAVINVSTGSHTSTEITEGEYVDMELEARMNELEGNSVELTNSEVTPHDSLEFIDEESSSKDNDEIVIDGDKYKIAYFLEDDLIVVLDENDDIVKELTLDDIDIEEQDGEIFVDRITNTIVEVL